MRLYHYRTIETALSELDDGSFYFAATNELNDPIEGYVKIFCQGDAPAWEGLLKNYACSMFYNLQTYLLIAERLHCASHEKFFDDMENKLLLTDLRQFDGSVLQRIFDELAEKFLDDDGVRRLTKFYGDDIKCYDREMEFIFRAVTNVAFKICVGKFKNLGLIGDDFDENFFDVAYEISFDELKSVTDAERKRRIDETENLNHDVMESGLLSLKLNPRDKTDSRFCMKKNLLWFQFTFPRTYLDRLKKMMYPNGYVVCLSATPTNSAMWGNYAGNHRGVCLIYDTENIDGREFITFAAKSLEVEPIKYTEQIIERNFFDSLRYLKFLHAEDWLTGRNGIKSRKLNEEIAAGEYEDDYREKFYRKTADWNYEREYRIFLPDKFYRYGNRMTRNLRYDLNALKGIIFGIRTTLDDKFKLLRKLERLGKSVRNFEFFQAEFDDETQLISIREKILLMKSD